MNSNSLINFQVLEEESHFAELEEIQREAWGMPELELIPRRLFKATKRSGAVLIGAIINNKVVGYVWGWVGNLPDYGIFIYSHHNAVREQYQNQGIGYTLKIKQREWAKENRYELVNWTFDPLQSKNCYLNLHKLGAICSSYKANYWGEMHDEENIGLPTDRFYCNWHINSAHVKERLDGKYPNYSQQLKEKQYHAIETKSDKRILSLKRSKKNLNEKIIFIEIPSNINEIRKLNNSLALEWRMEIRKILQNYFRKQYTAIDFILDKSKSPMRCYHVLEKKFQLV